MSLVQASGAQSSAQTTPSESKPVESEVPLFSESSTGRFSRSHRADLDFVPTVSFPMQPVFGTPGWFLLMLRLLDEFLCLLNEFIGFALG